MDRIGIDCLSVFGMPPVQFVGLAADLGCRYISTALQPVILNPASFPDWTLRDRTLRREMVKAMDDRGVSLSLGEGLIILPGKDAADYLADVDAMAELGVPLIATASLDPDMQRSLDQIARLAEMAANVGMNTAIEFVPVFAISNLSDAVAAVHQIGLGKLRIIVDCMHLARSGGTVNDLTALEPGIVSYIQLCDVPLVAIDVDYMHEAMCERMVPGTGEVPLKEILAALPRDIVVGLEIPQESCLAALGDSRSCLAKCVTAARDMLCAI
jgi:sugar phosphate isomerase/epimerase